MAQPDSRHTIGSSPFETFVVMTLRMEIPRDARRADGFGAITSDLARTTDIGNTEHGLSRRATRKSATIAKSDDRNQLLTIITPQTTNRTHTIPDRLKLLSFSLSSCRPEDQLPPSRSYHTPEVSHSK